MKWDLTPDETFEVLVCVEIVVRQCVKDGDLKQARYLQDLYNKAAKSIWPDPVPMNIVPKE